MINSHFLFSGRKYPVDWILKKYYLFIFFIIIFIYLFLYYYYFKIKDKDKR